MRLAGGSEKMTGFLNDNGIEARTYYPIPLHLQDCYKGLGYKKGSLKESEKAAKEVFSIAVYPELKAEEKEYVVSVIKKFFLNGYV
jgi:dTDP-4-amino-4,6-dideoxygalactose transaminase